MRGASFDKKELKRNVAGSGAYAPSSTVYTSHINVDIHTSPITFVLLMHVANCIIICYAHHELIIYFVLTSHGNSF